MDGDSNFESSSFKVSDSILEWHVVSNGDLNFRSSVISVGDSNFESSGSTVGDSILESHVVSNGDLDLSLIFWVIWVYSW